MLVSARVLLHVLVAIWPLVAHATKAHARTLDADGPRASARVPGLLPDVLAAADPLAGARAAFAAARYQDAKAALANLDAPGLLGATLAALGDEAGACALYAQESTSAHRAAAALRSARCQDAAGDVAGALALWHEVGAGPFAGDALVIDELAAFLDRRALDGALLARALAIEVPLFDQARREALSRALLVAVRRGDRETSSRALDVLLTQLANTDGARAASALPQAKLLAKEDLIHALARATALDKRHDSAAVIRALAPFSSDIHLDAKDQRPGANSVLACEAQLLLGKSQRKLRKYAAAKKHLDAVANSCPNDVKKRGAYLAARVAWLSRNAAAAPLLRAFADTWPTDTLGDDVLLWLGDVHARAGRSALAERTWREIFDNHPSGDMIHEARFRLAWSRAQAADADGARALFDEAARGVGPSPASALLVVADRALYWRARLAFAPRLDSLEPTADARVREQALAALSALAAARPAGWYGHLARLLVRTQPAAGGAAAAPLINVAARVRERALHGLVSVSDALSQQRDFALARALVEGGYDAEALMQLASLPLPMAAEDRFAVALLMDRAGARGGAHGYLRGAGLALLPGAPTNDNALAWSLNWPRPFSTAIITAADASGLPSSLLFGLAREESAFDPEVISWAGAVGLCQLMPPTAADEARATGLPVPDVSALREPSLNARLGAAHLARRLKLGHPALAIAAYNAGPGAVADWAPHGPLDAWVEQIPVEETRNYVKKVTGSWVTYAILDGSVDDVTFPLLLR